VWTALHRVEGALAPRSTDTDYLPGQRPTGVPPTGADHLAPLLRSWIPDSPSDPAPKHGHPKGACSLRRLIKIRCHCHGGFGYQTLVGPTPAFRCGGYIVRNWVAGPNREGRVDSLHYRTAVH